MDIFNTKGSGCLKCGLSGSETATLVMPSICKYENLMPGDEQQKIYMGLDAEKMRGVLSLNYPISNGIINDWGDMELLWTYMYTEMKIQSENHPTLISEAPLNPVINAQKMAEIFFETFEVPALNIASQASLSLYASGRTSGVVLDSGDGVTFTAPIYEGYIMKHSIGRSEVAGREVTKYLIQLLRRVGYFFKSTAEFEIAKNIKEAACCVLFNMNQHYSETSKYPYVLPDDTQITLDMERFQAPELLFNPQINGLSDLGVQHLLLNTIMQTDVDLYADRLLYELRNLTSKTVKLRIVAPPSRRMSTWEGGSIVGSLVSYRKLFISKKQYEESGYPSVIKALS